MRALATTLFLSLSLAGCAAVPMADKQTDAQAKRFASSPDMSRIYIYRNEYFGAAVKMPVVLDGKVLGKTVAHSYLFTEVVPGRHIITADGENTDMLKLVTKPGENIFIHQQVKLGLVAGRSGMSVVPEAEGKAGVLECDMIEPQY
jgi:hypothetical protein